MALINWLNNMPLLGRMLILPFALLESGIVLILVRRLLIFPRASWQRLSISVGLMAAILSIVATQIHGYQWIASRRHAMDDNFVAVVLILENSFSLFLLFFVALRRKESASKNII